MFPAVSSILIYSYLDSHCSQLPLLPMLAAVSSILVYRYLGSNCSQLPLLLLLTAASAPVFTAASSNLALIRLRMPLLLTSVSSALAIICLCRHLPLLPLLTPASAFLAHNCL
jgi:hypothetical protein